MLNITSTTTSPEINFNTSKGVLIIKGRSYPENAQEFYQELVKKIEEYTHSPCPKTSVHISLVYFNTASSKVFLDIFHQLESLRSKSMIAINWYYEKGDEDMLEAGKDYSEMLNLPFEMIEID